MRFTLAWLLAIPALLAPQPAVDRTTENHIRSGNDAVARGQFVQAEAQYAAAEEHTADPGLVLALDERPTLPKCSRKRIEAKQMPALFEPMLRTQSHWL